MLTGACSGLKAGSALQCFHYVPSVAATYRREAEVRLMSIKLFRGIFDLFAAAEPQKEMLFAGCRAKSIHASH